MKLFDFIQNTSPDKILFVSENLKYTAGELANLSRIHSNFIFSECYHKKVALSFNDDFELAKWLVLLDGVVNRLTLLPAQNDDVNNPYFIKLSESDFVISDHEITNQNVPFVNIHNITSLKLLDNIENLDISSEWVLTTSGTTGTPKLVRHTLNSLINTTKNVESKHTNVWGLLYGLQRFAGLQVFFQSFRSNNTLIITNNLNDLTNKINLFFQYNVNCLSATPTYWRKLLMLSCFQNLNLRVITLGGEIVDTQILTALTKSHPQAKIRHIYASTEAGAGFSVTDGLSGFPIEYLSNTHQNIKLKISDHKTLLIKSNSESIGYMGSNKFAVIEDYIDTGDLISIKNGRCYFEGRQNGTINIGGNKVQPEYVEKIIASFPGVKLVSVSAKKNSIIGNLVQAHVVIDSNIDDNKKFVVELKHYCKKNLEKYMSPSFVTIVDDIKINATGKIMRNG